MKPVHVWLLAAVTKPRWAHDWRNYCLHVKKNHLIPLIIKLLYTKALQVSRIYLQKSSCCFIKHHYLYFFSSDIPVHFGLLAGAKLPFALTQELGAHLWELSLPSLGSLFPAMSCPGPRTAPSSAPKTQSGLRKNPRVFISFVPTATLIALNWNGCQNKSFI